MAWRDRFKQGSYRGVPFFIESAEGERSQRIAKHKFPARNKAYLEEMGKNPGEHTLEVFVIGEDCFEQRDRLEAACGRSGSGRLVHPMYGELLVKCENWKTRHDKSELGMVRFSLSFTEVEETNIPLVGVVDTQAKTLTSARALVDQQKTTFERLFDYASLPYSQARSVQTLVNGAVDDIAKARALVGQVAAFGQAVEDIGGSLSTLLLDAEQLVNDIVEIITFGFLTEDSDDNSTPDVKQSFSGLSDLFQYAPVIATESAASSAFVNMIRGISIAQGAHLISIAEFDSVEEATEFRDILFAAIDSYQETDDLDDELYVNMSAVRAAVESDIAERSVILPRLVDMLLSEFVPALVLSYQLYGTTDSEESIIRRNRITHPGLVPANVPIKVLTDG